MTHNASIKTEYLGMVSPLRCDDTGGQVAVVAESKVKGLGKHTMIFCESVLLQEEMHSRVG